MTTNTLAHDAAFPCPQKQGALAAAYDPCILEGYPELLTVQHVQKLTGLSEQTIRSEINAGRIPGCRIGRRLYVPKQRFIHYMMKGGGLNV